MSSDNRPFTIIPERGKVFNDSDTSFIKDIWRVFSDDVLWSNFANNSPHFSPQP